MMMHTYVHKYCQAICGWLVNSVKYFLQIKKCRRVHHYVDAGDSSRSNWLRLVNCARFEQEQNLMAFQYKGQMYYR